MTILVVTELNCGSGGSKKDLKRAFVTFFKLHNPLVFIKSRSKILNPSVMCPKESAISMPTNPAQLILRGVGKSIALWKFSAEKQFL